MRFSDIKRKRQDPEDRPPTRTRPIPGPGERNPPVPDSGNPGLPRPPGPLRPAQPKQGASTPPATGQLARPLGLKATPLPSRQAPQPPPIRPAAQPAKPAPAAKAGPSRPFSGSRPGPRHAEAGNVDAGRAGIDAHASYGGLILLIKEIAKDWADGSIHQPDAVRQAAGRCRDLLGADPCPLLTLAARSTAGNYLYAHSANVCIYSMHLGMGLGWDREPVAALGSAALLHELLLAEAQGLPVKTGTPTAEESRELRLHPLEPRGLKKHLAGLENAVGRAVTMLRAEDLPDATLAAHLIGICDLYEARSHYRVWREPMLPHDAVRAILKGGAEEFDRKARQAFLERITLYPPGSFVQLSTGEIARVACVNPQTPTLPKLKVFLAADGALLEPPRPLDLAAHPVTHISRPVDETKLRLKDKKLLVALQAERWWVS